MASETADKIKSGCNIVDVIGKEVKKETLVGAWTFSKRWGH